MSVNPELIESLDLFSGLASADIARIAVLMNTVRVKEGEELFRRNAPAHTFFVILSGHYLIAFKEGRAITLHDRGDIMGWSTVVAPLRYTAAATALCDGEVLILSSEDFLGLVRANSALGDCLMERITQMVADRMALAGKSK